MRQNTAKKIQEQRYTAKKEAVVTLIEKPAEKASAQKQKAPLTNQEYIEQMERRSFERFGDFA